MNTKDTPTDSITMEVHNPYHPTTFIQKKKLVTFLHDHLDRFGDAKDAIQNAIEYAMKERSAFGGFIVSAMDGDKIVAATVLNKTGMEGYVPEYLLVYIATHRDYRGKGIGKRLMKEAIAKCDGSIALHVEADNPAIHLYEKLGFETKYKEMRYLR